MIGSLITMIILSANISAKATFYNDHFFEKKTISIIVNAGGQVIIGRDTLSSDQLADELQKRLWKSYMGTDKMYDAIRLELKDEVPVNIKESIKKAILEGQQKALTDICLQKYKKLFEDLSDSQQGKIRKQFPVLFQRDY